MKIVELKIKDGGIDSEKGYWNILKYIACVIRRSKRIRKILDGDIDVKCETDFEQLAAHKRIEFRKSRYRVTLLHENFDVIEDLLIGLFKSKNSEIVLSQIERLSSNTCKIYDFLTDGVLPENMSWSEKLTNRS